MSKVHHSLKLYYLDWVNIALAFQDKHFLKDSIASELDTCTCFSSSHPNNCLLILYQANRPLLFHRHGCDLSLQSIVCVFT